MHHRRLLVSLSLSLSFAVLTVLACEPAPVVAPDGVARVPLSLLQSLFSTSCWGPADEQARLNPGAPYELWLKEHMFEPVLVDSPFVVVDEARVAGCEAAIASDDCGLIDSACYPLRLFLVGTQSTGEDCSDDVECSSGWCEEVFGGCGHCLGCLSDQDCASDERCSPEGCIAAVGEGEVCDADRDCVGDLLCGDDGRCAPRGDVGAACDVVSCRTDLVCRTDGVCGAPPAVGEACRADECADGVRCIVGVCTAPDGQDCAIDRCATGYACDTTTCRPQQVGDVCGTDWYSPCGDELRCGDDNACVARVADGEVCDFRPNQCATGSSCDVFLGDEGRCRSYDTVAIGADCSKNICTDGFCMALTTGEERCVPYDTFDRPGGESCRNDVLLPACRYPFVCGDDDDGDNTGTCIRPGIAGRGEACGTEVRCENELLDTQCVDGVCVARPDVGEACDAWSYDLATQYNGCNALTSYCDWSTEICLPAGLGDTCSLGCTVGLACRGGRCVEADELVFQQCAVD